MLERSSLFTEEARLCGEDCFYQQDNATIHTARRLKDFFQANNIRFFLSSIVFTGLEPYRERLGIDGNYRTFLGTRVPVP